MAPEHFDLDLGGRILKAMVNHAEMGWEAACRFPEVDYLISRAGDRETAIEALKHIMRTPLDELARDVDETARKIGAEWEIRSRIAPADATEGWSFADKAKAEAEPVGDAD